MKRHSTAFGIERPRERRSMRGVALVTTLILLTLLSAAGVAIFVLVSSDTMINGYYGNFRGSFYAADSGINVTVEAISNAIQTTANPAVNPPLPINGPIPTAITSSYAPYQAGYTTIGDPGSWKEQFQMVANQNGVAVVGAPQTLAGAANFCVQNPVDAAHPTDNVTCDYIYPYTVTVAGRSSGSEQEQITESGQIHYHSFSGDLASTAPPSFAKWGAFITKYDDCQGPLVPGTMTGPFFTDGQWNFGDFSNPGYTFVDSIGEPGNQISWWPNGCSDSAYNNPPRRFNVPNFQSGFQPNQNSVTPPTNSYSQAQAVLDGKGTACTSSSCSATAPTQAQMNQELKTVTGTSYPSSGSAPTGVYIPYYTNSSGQKAYGSNPASGGDGAAGGFYINGNASVALSATTGGDGTSNATQTYTITQGGTTTTIIVDTSAGSTGTTTVKSNGTTLTLTGVPTQLDPNTGQPMTQTDPSGNPVDPTLIYVNGQITGMSGTVQNNTGITVAASSDISITGDLTYVQSPVSVPSDTLNSSTNAGVLGIYTTGNINLNPNSQGNLTVDASLAALSGQTNNPNSGFYTPGRGINTWTIVGGRSEDHAHAVNIGTGNTYYDRRFANNFGPPWFPTAVPQPGQVQVPSSYTATVWRTSWRELSR
jgi:hypothetical protein